MSDEKVTTATEQQAQTTEKSENMVPSYRLKEEADKRRAAENKLAEYEKAEQERKDAELSENEKLRKKLDAVTTEYDTYKKTAAQKELHGLFTNAVVEAGLPSKIAKVAIPSDLSEDNFKDKVKEAMKEFSEFVKTEEKKETKPTNPLASIQPAQPDGQPQRYQYPGQYTSKQAAEKLIKEIH